MNIQYTTCANNIEYVLLAIAKQFKVQYKINSSSSRLLTVNVELYGLTSLTSLHHSSHTLKHVHTSNFSSPHSNNGMGTELRTSSMHSSEACVPVLV